MGYRGHIMNANLCQTSPAVARAHAGIAYYARA